MDICKGKSVHKGIAIGKVYVYEKKDIQVNYTKITNVEEEIQRLTSAIEEAICQIDDLYQSALLKIKEEDAMIFDIHKMMILDEDYQKEIRKHIIINKMCAEYAVERTRDQYVIEFSSIEDPYMKQRSIDVRDISQRLMKILTGDKEIELVSDEAIIVVADDLTPSDTIQMDTTKVLGFVIKKGSENSHTSILARSMNLPCLVRTDFSNIELCSGKLGIIDGFDGDFILDPDLETQKIQKSKKFKWEEEQKELNSFLSLKDVTRDGRTIQLFANMESVEDMDKVIACGARGIGLFRTEFIYMGRETYPSEEEQYLIYKKILSTMNEKKVILRTLDIGADKQVDYFQLPQEENPALGYRAIRICLDRREIFRTQLRAMYRASVYGNLGIMFPMIISMEEVRTIKEIIEQVKNELTYEERPMASVEIGIMVETPAAALLSEELSKEVDFVSLGTNDLTQYTLAIDRQNETIENLWDKYHPAVLKLIQFTVENAHKAGAWVGICGELAADLTMTELFLEMGVDELSVAPSKVLELRKKIRSV